MNWSPFTMKSMLNHIKHMEMTGLICLEDFDNVSFDKNIITLQGEYSPSRIRDYSNLFDFHVCGIDGSLQSLSEVDGVEVKIVLFT